MKYKIGKVLGFRSYNSKDKGCFFYNQVIPNYYEETFKQGIRSYSFNLFLYEDNKEKLINELRNNVETPYEEIKFIATLDLKDYFYIREPLMRNNKVFIEESKEIDFNKIVLDFFDEDNLNFLKKHLKRKIENINREPIMVLHEWQHHNSLKGQKEEFLEFDETADRWAGPFNNGQKKGCYINVILDDEYKKPNIKDFSITSNLHNYTLPRKLYNKIELYGKSEEEKKDILSNLSTEDFISTIKKVSTSMIDDESILYKLPYRIHLSGNDDCSYSKGFYTVEEMNKEVQRLRNNQPLNFDLDIDDFNYIFTN